MGKRRRGRKTMRKDPSTTLPKIPALQKSLDPGSQDFVQATRTLTRARVDDLDDGDGDIYFSSSSPSWKDGGFGGKEGNRPAPPPEVCDPANEVKGHQHQDPDALARHLLNLGHHRPWQLIGECGVAAINVTLQELEDSEWEGVYSPPAIITANARLHAMGSPPAPPRATRVPFAESKPFRNEAQEPTAEEPDDRDLHTVTGSPDSEAQKLMAEVLAKLKLQVPRPMFETWLKALLGHDLTGDTFTIAAPTAFAVEWLNRRQYHAIASIVSELRGRETEVAFAVAAPVVKSEPFDSTQAIEEPGPVSASVDSGLSEVPVHTPLTGPGRR